MTKKRALFWFRRDLRFEDNRALARATEEYDEVIPLFIFDSNILDELPLDDKRVGFILATLKNLDHKVHLLYGDPVELYSKILKKLKPDAVFSNYDFEPYAKKRDKKIAQICQELKIDFIQDCDQTVLYPKETLKENGTPYQVFTPYKNNWLKVLNRNASEKLKRFKVDKRKIISIDGFESLKGFKFQEGLFEDPHQVFQSFKKKMNHYHFKRGFPWEEGTSRLSIHLRFGTISSRELVREVWQKGDLGSSTWLSELIWREFYFMILHFFPHVVSKPFKEKYQAVKWRQSKKMFKAWCEGQTGVPIVDAAMREFNQTGWMHNRLRMVVASYFCKILQLDWRLGEKYFASKLLDFDLSANNGGWQWSSSTGCDAAPYFRIFNPYTQSKKFDSDGEYIKGQLPELKNLPKKYLFRPETAPLEVQKKAGCLIGQDYPKPIINYEEARKECLERYKVAFDA